MSFKFLEGGVKELMEYTGCNAVFIPKNNDKYLIYFSNEPYSLFFYDSTDCDPRKTNIGVIMSTLGSNYLAIKNPTYIDMEKYISEYKHLIGCEFVGSCGGNFIHGIDFQSLFGEPFKMIVVCDHGYGAYLKDIMLYSEEGGLVTYEEYMELYYPEYRHVWEKQL